MDDWFDIVLLRQAYFKCIVFGDLHVPFGQNGAIIEVLGLFAEEWFTKRCWVIYIC
jgi:hypothetical protein